MLLLLMMMVTMAVVVMGLISIIYLWARVMNVGMNECVMMMMMMQW